MRGTNLVTCLIAVGLSLVVQLAATTAAEEAAPKPGAGKILLHLVDKTGTAQAEATVSLFRYDQDTRYWKDLKRDIRANEHGVAQYDALSTDNSYLVRAKTKDNRVAYRECIFTGEDAAKDLTLKVEPPIATSVHVRSETGKPITGAVIWMISHTGANGSIRFEPETLRECGLKPEASNSDGELVLPPLPPGKIDLRVIHPDYAPGEVKQANVGKATEIALSGGVKLRLYLKMEPNEKLVDSIVIDLRHSQFENPSTLIGRLPWLRPDGTAALTVAAGDYNWLRLRHPDFIAAPIYAERYGNTLADKTEAFRVRPGNDEFNFLLKRKVKVRGRVIDRATGRPVAKASIEGELHPEGVQGPFARFVDEWTHADWADTDAKGEYEIKLAAGRARVTFQGDGLVANPSSYELNVAADGSTVAPDFSVIPIPKVRGVVQDQHGRPVPNAVVRFRGSMLTYAVNPVIVNAQGRFELTPPWIPEDFQTHERLPIQIIVAFHPSEPMEAHAQIRLDDVDSLKRVVLRLEPQRTDSLITEFGDDLTPWQRGVVPKDQQEGLAAISLAGKLAPELDGILWLNTEDKRLSLADFRGKYVLLQFWTTWCGPCHADMPSVRLVENAYRDKGLVVIGVHDNSMPVEAIKQDAAKEKLTYPIVVDHPDGRILASYKSHGISGYPSYVLIGPDGKVVHDDDTVAGPTLRSFKIEIIRQLLMAVPAKR